MSTHDDLNNQIAQQLFGWAVVDGLGPIPVPPPEHDGPYTPGFVPDYINDPAATAQVWQWLEVHGLDYISFQYNRPGGSDCQIGYTYQTDEYQFIFTAGATWQEALCRAALIQRERSNELD